MQRARIVSLCPVPLSRRGSDPGISGFLSDPSAAFVTGPHVSLTAPVAHTQTARKFQCHLEPAGHCQRRAEAKSFVSQCSDRSQEAAQ